MEIRDIAHFFWAVAVFGIAFFVFAETKDVFYVFGVLSGGIWGHLFIVDLIKKVLIRQNVGQNR